MANPGVINFHVSNKKYSKARVGWQIFFLNIGLCTPLIKLYYNNRVVFLLVLYNRSLYDGSRSYTCVLCNHSCSYQCKCLQIPFKKDSISFSFQCFAAKLYFILQALICLIYLFILRRKVFQLTVLFVWLFLIVF